MPHCFKNIRNNWVTEPSRTLEFVEPITQKVHQAKWKDLHAMQLTNQGDEAVVSSFVSNQLLRSKKHSWRAIYSTRNGNKNVEYDQH